MYNLRVLTKALLKPNITNVRWSVILLFLVPLWMITYNSFFKKCPRDSESSPKSTAMETRLITAALQRQKQVKYASEDGTQACVRKRYLGDSYGGWIICEPANVQDLKQALVYTVGVSENIEWDKAMMSHYGTVHHGWDPTPRAVEFIKSKPPPKNFHFHKYGLSFHDGSVTATLPVGNHASYTISTYEHADAQVGKETQIPVLHIQSMLKMLSHNHLAILKIDIEGSEFDVIQNWAETNYQVPADQILIEFHERYFKSDKSLVSKAIQQMKDIGFEVFHRTKLEISFIRSASS